MCERNFACIQNVPVMAGRDVAFDAFRFRPFIARIAIGEDAADASVFLDVLQNAITALGAAAQVFARCFVDGQPVALTAKAFAHDVATDETKRVIVAHAADGRDGLTVEFAHEETIGIGGEKGFGIVQPGIPPGVAHPGNGNRGDPGGVQVPNAKATTGQIASGW